LLVLDHNMAAEQAVSYNQFADWQDVYQKSFMLTDFDVGV
jgi:hypothetical protein